MTQSTVKWYGKGTRSEYRLTGGFGGDFPYLNRDSVGDLLILIPVSYTNFLGYVLQFDEEMEEFQSALGVELVGRWAAYEKGKEVAPESPQECVERLSRKWTEEIEKFPSTKLFSQTTREIISECLKEFQKQPLDKQLLGWVDAEYRLFRMLERKLYQNQVMRPFKDIDDFLSLAQTILQRRKSRAGLSLEHHVEYILHAAQVPFTAQSTKVDGKPDIVIPSAAAYLDTSFSPDKICVLGIKTTCKDRWRQVTKEAKRVEHKHILTLQSGISEKQLAEMEKEHVTLVVPQPRHVDYPPSYRPKIMTVEAFITQVLQLTA